MAEVSVGGVSFKGGRMMAVILALSSAVGVLYGGFEAFKQFQDRIRKLPSRHQAQALRNAQARQTMQGQLNQE